MSDMQREESIEAVAPARERGLKCHNICPPHKVDRRSREGAWIEIQYKMRMERRRERGRSREGAWIEMLNALQIAWQPIVAPARERGLKFIRAADDMGAFRSLPRGSVD